MAVSEASAELLRIDRTRLLTANVHLERSNIELRGALEHDKDPEYQQAIEARGAPPPSFLRAVMNVRPRSSWARGMHA